MHRVYSELQVAPHHGDEAATAATACLRDSFIQTAHKVFAAAADGLGDKLARGVLDAAVREELFSPADVPVIAKRDAAARFNKLIMGLL
jgi:hypothetical protein